MYKFFFKRWLDFLIAILALIIFFPLFVIIFIAVKLDSKGDFFFLQERVGKDGSFFKVVKIRTMIDTPRKVYKEILSGDIEVTRVGAFLRRFKLDEFPQIINVLKGDMSFIGPRPCMPSLIEKFNDEGKKRLTIRPGLTGLAQTNGNIYLSWEDRWKYDSVYIDNISFLLDVKIFFRSLLLFVVGEKKLLKKPNV